MHKLPVMLASSSPRRADILSSLGWNYKIVSPDVDETPQDNETGKELVVRLSFLKAKKVAEKHVGYIVIAADSVVEMEGQIYGKPGSVLEARNMLKRIRGKDHYIHTGITVMNSVNTTSNTHCVTTVVRAREYTDDEINKSIIKGTPFDKAGGYAIQDDSLKPVTILEGCYSGALGLPVCKLTEIMEDMQQDIQITKFVKDTKCKPECLFVGDNL